jgi:hypothetical protein
MLLHLGLLRLLLLTQHPADHLAALTAAAPAHQQQQQQQLQEH